MIFIDDMVIDAAETITPMKVGKATTHPISSGANVSDHIVLSPDTLTIRGIVSSTPMGKILDFREGVEDPVSDIREKFEILHKARKLINIFVSGYPLFTDMLLETLSDPGNARNGESMRFTAKFSKIRVVDVDVKKIEVRVDLPRNKRRKPKGTQTASEAPAKPETVEEVVERHQNSFKDVANREREQGRVGSLFFDKKSSAATKREYEHKLKNLQEFKK